MKNLLFIVVLLTGLNVFSQNKVYTLDKPDGIPCSFEKIKDATIVCMVDGVKTKFKAREVLGYVRNGYKYDSGRARYNAFGFKKWHFIYKVVDGKLNVYRHKVKSVKTSYGTPSKPDNTVSISGYYFYFRHSDNPRGVMVRPHMFGWKGSMRKILKDSPEALKVLEETATISGDWKPAVSTFNDPANVELYMQQIEKRAKTK